MYGCRVCSSKTIRAQGLLCSIVLDTTPGEAYFTPSLKNMPWNKIFQFRILVHKRQLSLRDKVGTNGDRKREYRGLSICRMPHY